MEYEVRYQHKGQDLKDPIEATSDTDALEKFRNIVNAAVEMIRIGWPIGNNHQLFRLGDGKPERIA